MRTGIRACVPLTLGLAFVAQCLWFIRTQSLTMDEPLHVLAGLQAWRGQFKPFNEHPPLARLLLTLPLLPMDPPPLDQLAAGRFPPEPEAVAPRIRLINVWLGLALGAALWSTARRHLSEGGANLALALFVFSPAMVAHYSLATTDGAGTLLVFLTAVQLSRWRRRTTTTQAVLLGLVLGASLAAKYYTAPLFFLALALVGLHAGAAGEPRRSWRAAALAGLTACLALWAVYAFHVTAFDLEDGRLTGYFPENRQVVRYDLPLRGNLSLYLPAAEYLSGLWTLARNAYERTPIVPSYFLGETSRTGGWLLFFPVVIALKWPATVLALLGGAALLALRGRLRLPGEVRVMLLFPGLFLVLAVFSRMNIGDRHLLPVYPFVLLVCASLWSWLPAGRARFVLALGAIGLQLLDVARYAPDHLSYFSPLVRPAQSYRFLTDSSLDWGQGLIALREYERRHPERELRLAYFGPVQPALYGVRARTLPERERACGTIAVSATHLSGQALTEPEAYRWLLDYPLKALVNHSIHVFDVPCEPAPGQAAPPARPSGGA